MSETVAPWLEVHGMHPYDNATDEFGSFVRLVETTELTNYYMTAPWPLSRKFHVAFVGEAFSGHQSPGGRLWLRVTNRQVVEGVKIIKGPDIVRVDDPTDGDVDYDADDTDIRKELGDSDDWSPAQTLEDLYDDWSAKIMTARKTQDGGGVDPPHDSPATDWQVTELGTNNVTLILDEHKTRYMITIHDLQKFFEQCDDILRLMEWHPVPAEW